MIEIGWNNLTALADFFTCFKEKALKGSILHKKIQKGLFSFQSTGIETSRVTLKLRWETVLSVSYCILAEHFSGLVRIVNISGNDVNNKGF